MGTRRGRAGGGLRSTPAGASRETQRVWSADAALLFLPLPPRSPWTPIPDSLLRSLALSRAGARARAGVAARPGRRVRGGGSGGGGGAVRSAAAARPRAAHARSEPREWQGWRAGGGGAGGWGRGRGRRAAVCGRVGGELVRSVVRGARGRPGAALARRPRSCVCLCVVHAHPQNFLLPYPRAARAEGPALAQPGTHNNNWSSCQNFAAAARPDAARTGEASRRGRDPGPPARPAPARGPSAPRAAAPFSPPPRAGGRAGGQAGGRPGEGRAGTPAGALGPQSPAPRARPRARPPAPRGPHRARPPPAPRPPPPAPPRPGRPAPPSAPRPPPPARPLRAEVRAPAPMCVSACPARSMLPPLPVPAAAPGAAGNARD